MPNAKDLREKLGLTDLTTPTGKASDRKTTTPPGGGALQRDLQQAFEEGRGSNALRGVTSQPTSGGVGYVPSTSPLNEPLPEPVQVPQLSPTIQQVTAAPPASVSTGVAKIPGPITVDEMIDAAEPLTTPLGIDFRRESGLDAWEQQAAERENRAPRIANMWGEEYDEDGAGNGWFDNQLYHVGNTATNDAYARYFSSLGMSDDDVWALMHRPQTINDEKEMLATRNVSPDLFDGTGALLDDGVSLNYFDLTADDMTGTQYRKYRDELGMGGRSGYIDPTQTYSKKQEANEYGFIPFTPDMTAYLNMSAHNLLDIPAKVGSAVSNAREFLTPDYQIEYDDNGTKRSVSGRDFDKNSGAFMNSFYYDRRFNPDKFLSAPTDGTPYTTLVNQFEVPDVDGKKTYHYGHLVDVATAHDGNIIFSFSDGSSVKTDRKFFESVYDPESESVGLTPDVVPLQAASSIVDLDSMGPGKHQATVMETTIPDANGNETYHYGNLVNVGDGPNGTFAFSFEDGSTVNAPADFFYSLYDPDTGSVNLPEYDIVFLDDVRGDLDVDLGEPKKQTLENADVKYMPDMVLSDGTRMKLEDVERIRMDKSPDDDEDDRDPNTGKSILTDDDIRYGFSGLGNGSGLADVPFVGKPVDAVLGAAGKLPVLNMINNRPARLGGQEIFKDNDLVPDDLSNIGNDLIDWTAGSIPISLPGILPYIYSASAATRAINGINPASYNPTTGSYGLTAGDWDENGNLRYGVYDLGQDGSKEWNDEVSEGTRWSNFLGNLLTPVSESIVGPVGEHIIPLEKLADKIPMKSALGRLARNELVGAAGEGVEEILGNIFEDATSYGPDMFAEPVINDETGEPMTDLYGHELRRHDTSPMQRINNFAGDVAGNANAFVGGAGVSGVMSLLPKPWRDAYGRWHTESLGKDIRNAAMQDRARLMTGVPLYVEPEDVEPRETGAGLFDDRGMIRNEGA